MIRWPWYRWFLRKRGYRTFRHRKGNSWTYTSLKSRSPHNFDNFVETMERIGWVEEKDA